MAQQNPNTGLFLPTTQTFDPSLVGEDKKLKELMARLYQAINSISVVVNIKEGGYYIQNEFVTGALFFPNPALTSQTAQQPTYRQIYRLIVDFGSLPNNSTKSVPHGLLIDARFRIVLISAASTKPTAAFSEIPIPYSSTTAADIIELNIDATDVNITTHSDKTAYTLTTVIIEYIKQ